MNQENKKNPNLSVFLLLLALIFGILGGIISSFYLWPNFYDNNLSLGKNEINLNSPEYMGAGLIIQDPKKVYVSQDLKVEESINYLNESLVGIFPKIKSTSTEKYFIEDELFSGIIISNDGWVMANVLGLNNFDKNIFKNNNSFVLISKKAKKVYDIESVVDFSEKGLIFLKIKDASNLVVRNFVNISDIKNGQGIMAYNFSGDLNINYISKLEKGALLKFSDNFKNNIVLNNNLSDKFKNSFLFNINGDLLALSDSSLNIYPIHDFRPYIYHFLKTKELKKFDFGFYYIDLKDVADNNLPLYGAWVYNNNSNPVIKGKLADLFGIQSGDVIVKINNFEINDHLSFNDILNNFVIGDKISLFIIRDGELREIKIDLK